MESNLEYDLLKFSKEKSIVKMLEPNEYIIMTCSIYKFNRKLKRQERNLMITNKGIYNLSKTSLKRKISINKIHAVTVSKQGTEFVLHIPEEYDYRYSSTDNRDKILDALCKGYTACSNQLLPFYFKDDVTLQNYTTTKADKKKNINRMPNEAPALLNSELFQKKMAGENQKQNEMAMNTKQLFSQKKGEKCTIQDFNILKVVGRGAFGKVMLVEKKDTKEVFALKSIRKEDIIDKDQIEHTKTERIILEHCNHPFLVNLEYAFTTPEKIFFVTQFMKGGELFQHLRHCKKFEEIRCRFYVAQIALALGHLHQQNIIYRDLKPENILMDEFGYISLTDFGMAKIVKKGELAMSFCGTPEYLSPEIITGVGHTKTCDWWALGIFTFEMLFALPPFYNQNQETMFNAIKSQDIKFPSHTHITDEAKDFILKCCIKDSKKRLGAISDIEEIKQHPWFKTIDWEKLLKKEIEPPFKPNIMGDDWLNNFDEEFTKEDPINSLANQNQVLVDEYQEEFSGFSYNQQNLNDGKR